MTNKLPSSSFTALALNKPSSSSSSSFLLLLLLLLLLRAPSGSATRQRVVPTDRHSFVVCQQTLLLLILLLSRPRAARDIGLQAALNLFITRTWQKMVRRTGQQRCPETSKPLSPSLPLCLPLLSRILASARAHALSSRFNSPCVPPHEKIKEKKGQTERKGHSRRKLIVSPDPWPLGRLLAPESQSAQAESG